MCDTGDYNKPFSWRADREEDKKNKNAFSALMAWLRWVFLDASPARHSERCPYGRLLRRFQ